ncbi:MAG: hypothetical protein PUG12_00095 [Prevotella sp.]|nr:hypothetical protein [Prevotella sp.]
MEEQRKISFFSFDAVFCATTRTLPAQGNNIVRNAFGDEGKY